MRVFSPACTALALVAAAASADATNADQGPHEEAGPSFAAAAPPAARATPAKNDDPRDRADDLVAVDRSLLAAMQADIRQLKAEAANAERAQAQRVEPLERRLADSERATGALEARLAKAEALLDASSSSSFRRAQEAPARPNTTVVHLRGSEARAGGSGRGGRQEGVAGGAWRAWRSQGRQHATRPGCQPFSSLIFLGSFDGSTDRPRVQNGASQFTCVEHVQNWKWEWW